MRDTGFMIWFTLKIGNLETTGGQWIESHMLPTFRPTISPLCIRIWVLGLTLISLLSNSTHARTRPRGRPYLLFRLQSLPLFKERWDNVSMRKWERISFPHGQGEIRGRTPTQHQFNNYFSDPVRVEVLADWRDEHRARPLRLPRKLLRHRSAMGRVSLIKLRCNTTPFLQISLYLWVSDTSCSMASQPEPCRPALQAVLQDIENKQEAASFLTEKCPNHHQPTNQLPHQLSEDEVCLQLAPRHPLRLRHNLPRLQHRHQPQRHRRRSWWVSQPVNLNPHRSVQFQICYMIATFEWYKVAETTDKVSVTAERCRGKSVWECHQNLASATEPRTDCCLVKIIGPFR